MFWSQTAAEGVFCCYNNSLCAAEMLRKSKRLALALSLEVNGEGNVSSQQCLWTLYREGNSVVRTTV